MSLNCCLVVESSFFLTYQLQLIMIFRRSVLRWGVAERKKNSAWIYSNKSQQMGHIHKGRIFVCTDVGEDVHNCTLRMHKAISASSLVLAYQPSRIQAFLKALAQKDRFVLPAVHGFDTEIVRREDQGEIVVFGKQKELQMEYELEIQQSKQIEMAEEVEKILLSNNDRTNTLLLKHQKQLTEFMKVNFMKEQLEGIKALQGHPKVVGLKEHLERLEELSLHGVDCLLFLSEMHIATTKFAIQYLESHSLPYEVLPSTNHLLSMTVATGFPADRFSIQYFPVNITETLRKRRPMKLTVNLVIDTLDRFEMVEAVMKVYGKKQIIFVQANRHIAPFRGMAEDCLKYLQESEKESPYCLVSVAAYLSDFNEDLLEEKSQKTRLYGEAMSQTTNFVRLEFIADELQQLEEKSGTHSISTVQLITSLLSKITNTDDVLKVMKEIVAADEQALRDLIEDVRSRMGDPMGLNQMLQK